MEVVAGLPSGIADPNDPQVQEELLSELRGLRTMHIGDTPRIHPQAKFQADGAYGELAGRDGIGD